MKTTIELPDELMREIKVRAAREDKRLKDVIAELLRRGMATDDLKRGHRVSLPLIRTGHAASPDEEATPERIHEVLLQQEIDAFLKTAHKDSE